MKDTIQVTLSWSEALILFEWLASLDERTEKLPVDAAEQQVLWRLEGQLEGTLTEILAPDYQQRLAIAKQNIVNNNE